MSARVSYSTADGNTVPYPPLFDSVRKNYGFIDTRGRPDRVAEIPEVQESMALATLLTSLAMPQASFISLGCDLGSHDENNARFGGRRVAGGYVQIIAGRWHDDNFKVLQSVAKTIGNALTAAAGSDRWEVNLQLSPVVLKFEEDIETQSIWIWFFARASTGDRAIASRERLLNVIAEVLASFQSSRNVDTFK